MWPESQVSAPGRRPALARRPVYGNWGLRARITPLLTLMLVSASFAQIPPDAANGTVYGQGGLGPWKVDYHTAALTVETVHEFGQVIHVTVRNVSGTTITGITISGAILSRITDGVKPDATYRISAAPPGSDEGQVIRVLAVLFEDRRPDDGDPSAIERMRYERLGDLFECTRCSAILSQLDPARLDDATIAARMQTLDAMPELEVLSLPEFSELRDRLQMSRRLGAASPNAVRGLVRGVGLGRVLCQVYVHQLQRRPESCAVPPSERNRAGCLKSAKRQYEDRLAVLRAMADRDLEMER